MPTLEIDIDFGADQQKTNGLFVARSGIIQALQSILDLVQVLKLDFFDATISRMDCYSFLHLWLD